MPLDETREEAPGERPLKRSIERSDICAMGWLARNRPDTDRVTKRVTPLRSAPVEVQVMGRESLDVLHARNVSPSGLGVYVPHGFVGFDLEAEVELVITLPGVTPFLASGVIKHVTGGGEEARHFGLSITKIDRINRLALDRYIRSRQDG